MLTGVNVCMFLHVGLLVEPLPAVLARVGPGVGVDQQVRGQGAGPLEGFTALLALGTIQEKSNYTCVIFLCMLYRSSFDCSIKHRTSEKICRN